MKIRLSELRNLVQDVIEEMTLRPDITLYHRSSKKFKVGDILTAQVEDSTGEHWMASHGVEKALEKARKESYPDLPSRLDCVYASLVPRSRFINKGYLYAIEPIGPTFVTDANIIDALGREYPPRGPDYNPARVYVNHKDELIQRYWEGVEPTRGNLGHLEVLMKSARVIDVVTDRRLRPDENITLAFAIDAYIPVFDDEIYINNKKTSVEKVIDLLQADSRVTDVRKSGSNELVMTLKRHSTVKVIRARYNSPKETDPGSWTNSPPGVSIELTNGIVVYLNSKMSAKLAKSVAAGETETKSP